MASSTSFDEFGDLRLDVGESSTSFLVCSRAMARSSPAFRSMLYGGFKESKPPVGKWVLKLAEENPEAFTIILNIVHGRLDKVPLNLSNGGSDNSEHSATVLYNVAKIADKYLMIRLLRPWAESWIHPFRPRQAIDTQDYPSNFCGEIATAAWLLGEEIVLAHQLDRAVLCMRFRGMAYKGRGWITDTQRREHRLGAMPPGPNEVLDLEGFSGTVLSP